MEKIVSLFKRDYDGTRQVYNEVVEGAEWVQDGEGIATEKFDGTCCMIRNGKLWRRYDRKLTKSANSKKKNGAVGFNVDDFKPAPERWEPAENAPNIHTGHWPGWVPVGNDPNDLYHNKAFSDCRVCQDGTYELVGAKVQGNPYSLESHQLWRHGSVKLENVPVDFDGLRDWLMENKVEGIVWHHPDGRMAKIKRSDFGIEWPIGKA